jgi:hypothetical protein
MSEQIDDCVPSPFKIGQRLQYRSDPSVRGVVTELTDKGFKYKLDYPQPVGPARYGMQTTEGEVYCRSWCPHGGFEVEAEDYHI